MRKEVETQSHPKIRRKKGERFIYMVTDPQLCEYPKIFFYHKRDAKDYQKQYWEEKDKFTDNPCFWETMRPRIYRYHLNCQCEPKRIHGELVDAGKRLKMPTEVERRYPNARSSEET